MRYLDPKADLTFKKVFGEHPDLLVSLLNALLPLPEGESVEELEYLPAELVLDNPLKKNSIVDVRCRDNKGRYFIVEMQMIWSPEFRQRVLFNASKAYVRQLDKNERYDLLQPVYSLNLVNDVFESSLPDTFYHHYKMVHVEHTGHVIDGLQLVFIELPKFTPHTLFEKRMAVLWLRYLTEVDEKTEHVSKELMEEPVVRKAVEVVEESAYTEAQLLGYEKFWDSVRVEKAIYYGSHEAGWRKGLEEGRAKGLKEGIAKGLEEGEKIKALEIARNLKSLCVSPADIAKATGLSEEEIAGL